MHSATLFAITAVDLYRVVSMKEDPMQQAVMTAPGIIMLHEVARPIPAAD